MIFLGGGFMLLDVCCSESQPATMPALVK